MTKKYLKKMPGSLRLTSDYLVNCQHMSYACCDTCADKYENILKFPEGCFWVNNKEEADKFINWYNTEMVDA